MAASSERRTARLGARLGAPLLAPLLPLLLLAPGCSEAPAKAPRRKAAPADAEGPPPLLGRVVPTKSTELRAPPNVFKVGGWRSISSWIELIDLAKEGKRVKKGDVVARFRFRSERAKRWIDDKVRSAEAAQKKSALEQERRLQELRTDRDNRVLAAERGKLDTLKAGAISKRQLRLYEIDHRIATFEVEAVSQRLAAFNRQALAERTFHQQAVARARAELARYHGYKKRFSLRAPHAGVVRYAYNRHRRRKVKKGDGMPSGMPVLSLARDEQLSVRIFVPEHRMEELAAGDVVVIRSLSSDAKHGARVREVERIPQEMGYLREAEDLPNAREKAFVVVADLTGRAGFAAGNEVRVLPPKRTAQRSAPGKGPKGS